MSWWKYLEILKKKAETYWVRESTRKIVQTQIIISFPVWKQNILINLNINVIINIHKYIRVNISLIYILK